MARNTIKTESEIVNDFMQSRLGLKGTFIRTITRADGEVDKKAIPNIVTALGLDHLANRAVADTGSKYGWVAVGTANYTPHINSQEILECDRKAWVSGASGNSRELIVATATWGGAADSVTSNQLEMAAICNHQTSGSGHYLNVANGLATVLADSDFLHLEIQVQVGSHNIAT